jgi:hypothetical protein
MSPGGDDEQPCQAVPIDARAGGCVPGRNPAGATDRGAPSEPCVQALTGALGAIDRLIEGLSADLDPDHSTWRYLCHPWLWEICTIRQHILEALAALGWKSGRASASARPA